MQYLRYTKTMDFFGKINKYTFLSLIVVELISLLTFLVPPLHQVAFLMVLLAAIGMAIWKLEYGLLILLAELFVGGKGQLFTIDLAGIHFSIRMALFIIVFGIWLVKANSSKLTAQKYIKNLKTNQVLWAYGLMGIVVAIGLLNGLLHNTTPNVLFDSNAWFFFALTPVFFHAINSKEKINHAMEVLLTSTCFIALKTIGTLVLFSHNIAGIGGQFYDWIRNSGVGEITYVSGTIFRIFFQSQVYIMIGFLIVVAVVLGQQIKNRKILFFLLGYLYLTSFALIISQSRSFWVGTVVAVGLLFIFSWIKFKIGIKKTVITMALLIVMVISQLMALQLITGNFGGNIVADRFKNLTSEAAGLSRINQLQPLTTEIFQQLIVGYGFGKTVTYISTDPRIVTTHPGGVYTTYAFEWGYLDIWLKLGMIGVLAYGFLLYTIVRQGFKKISTEPVLIVGTLCGLAALLATNIFSPYLNHPLGIGYVMLLSAIYQTRNNV